MGARYQGQWLDDLEAIQRTERIDIGPGLRQPGGGGRGKSMHRFVSELYASAPDADGDGIRATLAMLQAHVPITLHEVQSGTEIFDWTVPPEWKLHRATIKDPSGNCVVDASSSPRCVVRYSMPVQARMPLAELRRHIYSTHEHPDLMPHGDSYGSEAWGFFLTEEESLALPEGEYEVDIDASLEPGHMTYGECLLRGRSLEEVLISCHLGDPSCPNDNFSGIAVAAALAQRLLSKKTRYSYRFLFIPSTIGSIAWIVLNQSRLFRIKHGLVLAQLGNSGSCLQDEPSGRRRDRSGVRPCPEGIEAEVQDRALLRLWAMTSGNTARPAWIWRSDASCARPRRLRLTTKRPGAIYAAYTPNPCTTRSSSSCPSSTSSSTTAATSIRTRSASLS